MSTSIFVSQDLQDSIQALPDCIKPDEGARFLEAHADAVDKKAEETESWWKKYFPNIWSWVTPGEGQKIYSKEAVQRAANEARAYAKVLRKLTKPFCRASEQRNEIIRLMGEMYGLLGAVEAVNVTLTEAKEDLAENLAKSGTNWGLVAGGVAAIFLVMFFLKD